MSDNPSNVPDAPDGIRPDDGDTAAHVFSAEDAEQMPGGGGLGSRATAAADPLADRVSGGTSPNAPIDAPAPDDAAGSDALAEAESRQMAADADAREPHPTSL